MVGEDQRALMWSGPSWILVPHVGKLRAFAPWHQDFDGAKLISNLFDLLRETR
jgi:hypothetical protein